MDQVYIPKNRIGFSIGSYVVLKPLETEKAIEKPYFYNIEYIEPIKVKIITEIIGIIDKIAENENMIITGSFLDKGFNFNDVDVILITEGKFNVSYIVKNIENKTGIKTHIILLSNKSLVRGLETDPLYQMMLSRCVAKKRFIYKVKHKIDCKILDLHLLKSKDLIDNFDILTGNEKYYLTRNMVAISLYIKSRKISNKTVDEEIKRVFNLKSIKEIKQNMLDKDIFLKKYNDTYKEIFNKIMRGIKKHGSEQE